MFPSLLPQQSSTVWLYVCLCVCTTDSCKDNSHLFFFFEASHSLFSKNSTQRKKRKLNLPQEVRRKDSGSNSNHENIHYPKTSTGDCESAQRFVPEKQRAGSPSPPGTVLTLHFPTRHQCVPILRNAVDAFISRHRKWRCRDTITAYFQHKSSNYTKTNILVMVVSRQWKERISEVYERIASPYDMKLV